MRRLPAIALALLFSGPAFAYKHLGDTGGQYLMWGPDQLPLTWYVSTTLDDSLPQTIDPATGLYFQELAMIKSYCNWHWIDYCEQFGFNTNAWFAGIYQDAECAALDFEYGGLSTDTSGSRRDGIRMIFFEDPDDELGSTVNGLTVSWGSNTVVKEQNGNTYYAFDDTDIIFSAVRDWGTTPEMNAGCSSSYNLEGTATHEIGHALGMGHSCDDGDLCRDSSYLNATMYWQGGPCDAGRADINEDDIAGLEALYGPFATFYTDSQTFGGIPLTVDFKVETEGNIISADWSFGDGTSSTEVEPSHEYQSEGQFTVNAEFELDSDICGVATYSYRKLAFALVCDAPQSTFSYDFLENEDMVLQMVNQTPVTTYGCIDEISWEVYQGDELVGTYNAWSPKIAFPEVGDYVVKLAVGGPGGGTASELAITVDGKGGGCSTSGGFSGGAASFAGILLALGAVLRRRE